MWNLVSLATDVALLLQATKLQEPNSNNMPTTCYIAFSLDLLLKSKEDGTPTRFATEVYTILLQNPNATRDEIEHFAQRLQTVLVSLVRVAKESIEALSDFEYLWSYCTASNPAFCNAILQVQQDYAPQGSNNGVLMMKESQRRARLAREERLEMLKQTCWKLCCLAEEEQQTKETKSQYISGRRRRILSTASCLLLVASLADMSDSSSSFAEDCDPEEEEKKLHLRLPNNLVVPRTKKMPLMP